jgi:membrane protease YdiL (CAAX protease family)
MSSYYLYCGGFSILLALFFWIKIPKGSFKSYFARSRVLDRACIFLGIAALTLNIGITTVLGKLFPQFNPAQSTQLRDMMQDTLGKVLVLVLTMIFAPLVEELLFRGFLIDGVQNVWKKKAIVAVVISALFFALCHGLTQIPGVFLFAFCLGLLRLRTGTLRQTMFVHAGNNLFGICALYYQFEVSYVVAGMLLFSGIIALRSYAIFNGQVAVEDPAV